MKKFNRSFIVAAVSLLAAFQSNAMADNKVTPDGETNWQEHQQTVKTRAQVMSELKEARAQGQMDSANDSAYPFSAVTGTAVPHTQASSQKVREQAIQANQSKERFTDHNYFRNQ